MANNEPKTVGVIVGRFQTPYLHLGHKTLIENVLSRHEKVMIVLGCTGGNPTNKDPLDYNTRKLMIERLYPQIIIGKIDDRPSDADWSDLLDSLITYAVPDHLPILYGNRDSFIFSYKGEYEYRRLSEVVVASATALREVESEPQDSIDFRRGLIYAANRRHPCVYPTVDVAVILKKRILLGKKRSDGGALRFIGGFVDPSDSSLAAAAKREVFEETGGLEVSNLIAHGSSIIDDHRYRGSNDKIMSTFFTAEYIFGSPKASDDLDSLEWIHMDYIMENLIEPHQVFLTFLARYFDELAASNR